MPTSHSKGSAAQQQAHPLEIMYQTLCSKQSIKDLNLPIPID